MNEQPDSNFNDINEPVELAKKECDNCGKDSPVRHFHHFGTSRLFCSDNCYQEYYQAVTQKLPEPPETRCPKTDTGILIHDIINGESGEARRMTSEQIEDRIVFLQGKIQEYKTRLKAIHAIKSEKIQEMNEAERNDFLLYKDKERSRPIHTKEEKEKKPRKAATSAAAKLITSFKSMGMGDQQIREMLIGTNISDEELNSLLRN